VPVLEALPSLAFMFRDGVPRSALVEGAIEVVADTLSGAAPSVYVRNVCSASA